MALVLAEFSPGKSGQIDAVRSLLRLQARCEAAVGSSFYLASHQDFVRSVDGQVNLLKANYTRASTGSVFWDGSWWRRKPGGVLVATPGTSDHAQGIAADITFETAAARAWFQGNCGSERWSNAGDNFKPIERWHKRYNGPTTGTAGNSYTPIDIEDDDMFSDSDRALLLALKVALLDGRPETGFAKRPVDQILEASTNVSARLMAATGGGWDAFDELIKASRKGLDLSGLSRSVVDAVIAALPKSVSVDPQALAVAVDNALADNFSSVNANIDDQPTSFEITPK